METTPFVPKLPAGIRLFDGRSRSGNSCATTTSHAECMELKEISRSPSPDLASESSERSPYPARSSRDVGQAARSVPDRAALQRPSDPSESAINHHGRLREATTVWRVRVTVDDKPGVLEKFAGQLGPLGAEILTLQAHYAFRGVRKELVVSASEHLRWSDLVAAAHAAGTTVGPTPGVSDSLRKRSFVIEGVSMCP